MPLWVVRETLLQRFARPCRRFLRTAITQLGRLHVEALLCRPQERISRHRQRRILHLVLHLPRRWHLHHWRPAPELVVKHGPHRPLLVRRVAQRHRLLRRGPHLAVKGQRLHRLPWLLHASAGQRHGQRLRALHHQPHTVQPQILAQLLWLERERQHRVAVRRQVAFHRLHVKVRAAQRLEPEPGAHIAGVGQLHTARHVRAETHSAKRQRVRLQVNLHALARARHRQQHLLCVHRRRSKQQLLREGCHAPRGRKVQAYLAPLARPQHLPECRREAHPTPCEAAHAHLLRVHQLKLGGAL
mmetsp:Transcript_30603/g.99920  ORF Transcript_30603/g.99920 Transcript_30603/m.99920 type:complete len:300 (+) Transcript_30603:93-992(+)